MRFYGIASVKIDVIIFAAEFYLVTFIVSIVEKRFDFFFFFKNIHKVLKHYQISTQESHFLLYILQKYF